MLRRNNRLGADIKPLVDVCLVFMQWGLCSYIRLYVFLAIVTSRCHIIVPKVSLLALPYLPMSVVNMDITHLNLLLLIVTSYGSFTFNTVQKQCVPVF